MSLNGYEATPQISAVTKGTPVGRCSPASSSALTARAALRCFHHTLSGPLTDLLTGSALHQQAGLSVTVAHGRPELCRKHLILGAHAIFGDLKSILLGTVDRVLLF